jgi:hypothetical protein
VLCLLSKTEDRDGNPGDDRESEKLKRRLAAGTNIIIVNMLGYEESGSRSLPGGTGTVPHALGDDDQRDASLHQLSSCPRVIKSLDNRNAVL